MNLSTLHLSRREALAAMGVAALSCRTALADTANPNAATGKKGFALQLYTLRDPAKKDLPGTLKKAREIGFEYVQWSGMPNLPADQIRAALDAADLKAVAAHVSAEAFEKDFDKEVQFWKTVGVRDVAVGGMMKDCKADLAGWLRGAQRLDALGAKLREAGMRFSYHNHAFEFEKFPGDPRCKLDIVLESTRPENLCAEFDVAWVFQGGADPAAYFRKYKTRCPVVHIKDTVRRTDPKAKVQFKPLGQGDLDWKDVLAAGHEAQIEWYVYEQDSGEGSPFDYARASYEFLKKNLL